RACRVPARTFRARSLTLVCRLRTSAATRHGRRWRPAALRVRRAGFAVRRAWLWSARAPTAVARPRRRDFRPPPAARPQTLRAPGPVRLRARQELPRGPRVHSAARRAPLPFRSVLAGGL